MNEDLLIEIMLNLDYKSLSRFCSSFTMASLICNNPKFYLKYNHIEPDDTDYDDDDDFIWHQSNKKTKQNLDHELDEIEYYQNQYNQYKNTAHHIF